MPNCDAELLEWVQANSDTTLDRMPKVSSGPGQSARTLGSPSTPPPFLADRRMCETRFFIRSGSIVVDHEELFNPTTTDISPDTYNNT